MRDNKFTTTDYGLANWLVFNGIDLLGAVEYPPDTKKSFVFLASTELDDLVSDWETPTTELAQTCKSFFHAHREVKSALKESLNVKDV